MRTLPVKKYKYYVHTYSRIILLIHKQTYIKYPQKQCINVEINCVFFFRVEVNHTKSKLTNTIRSCTLINVSLDWYKRNSDKLTLREIKMIGFQLFQISKSIYGSYINKNDKHQDIDL